MLKRWMSSIISVALITVVYQSAAKAQEDFYAGKAITLVVSASAGGGYTTYARLLSRHIGRYIPGNPAIIVQHREGAGGIIAANYLYNVAPRDGTVLAAIHTGAISSGPLFGEAGVQYSPPDFTWIGSLNSENSLCLSWHTSPIKTFQDMLTREFIVGGVGDGSETDFYAFAINNLLGAKIKLITGYKGGTGINLAMERGEVEGRCAWSLSSMRTSNASWLEEKKIIFLLQLGLEKNPELPDVPLALDLAKNADERKVLELIVSDRAFGRVYLAPPGLPAERTKILRNAFNRMAIDKAFLEEAEKLGLSISPVTGEAIEQLIKKMYATPSNLVKAASEAMKRKDTVR